jgi:uridine kinase
MDRLIQELRQRKCESRPLTVGISGIDASGKTTFANALVARLRQMDISTEVIRVDDFHHPKSVRSKCDGLPAWCYYHCTFDWDRLLQELLVPLSRDGCLQRTLLHLDLASDNFSVEKTYAVDPTNIVIVEGVFLFQPRLLPFLDYRIMWQIDHDECLRRATARDGYLFGDADTIRARYRTKYLPGQTLYESECSPTQQAHLLVDNNDLSSPRFLFK